MKIIVRESQFLKLNEYFSEIPQGSPLFHHTSEERAIKIMDEDTLRGSIPSDSYLDLDTRLKRSKSQASISFTRDKNFEPGLSIGSSWESPKDLNVIFVLDRNKLKTRYKIEPFNYTFLDSSNDQVYEKNPELEERVLSRKIEPLRPFVVDIVYRGSDPEVKQKITDYLNS